ncbi:MAG: Xaa-Pro peptidase family protein [Chloroflexi bacterium]|nr:Xaa-Pro peptidase family protein [Chloroflexota bacterium]
MRSSGGAAGCRGSRPIPLFGELKRPADAGDIRSLTFDESEFQRRHEALRTAMRTEGLDALVCTFAPSVCYVSGYETLASFAPMFLIVGIDREPTLLVDDFEAFNAIVSSWVEDVVTFPWGEDPAAVLVDVLRQRGWAGARLGWDHHQHGGAYQSYLRAAESVGASWSYVHLLVDGIRARKSAAEIAAIRSAGAITPRGFDAARAELRPDAPDTNVAAAAYRALVGAGSERMSIQPIVTAGRNSGIPHTTFGRSRLTPGHPAILEWGACVKRYTAPMIRTGVIGELADPLWDAMYAACLASVERTIAGMRPGVSTRELGEHASEPLHELPPRVFRDGLRGYSVGLSFEPDWLDVPGLRISPRGGRSERLPAAYPTLEPGHVFHVRAVVRDVGRAGVGVSETVAVTADGCEVLTDYPRDPLRLG